jgi:uncharacterized protein (DUF1778 family)
MPNAAVLERQAAKTEKTSNAASNKNKTTSINLRVPQQTRVLIDTAAAATGKSRTEFMLESARQHAIDVLLDQRLFVLTAEQHEAFLSALENPPQPSARLKKLLLSKPVWEK